MAVNSTGNTKVSSRFCTYFCRYRKGILSFIWLTVIGGWFVNFLYSWSTTKNIDFAGTPLDLLRQNPKIAATLVLFIVLFTILFGLICPLLEKRSTQYAEPHLVSPEEAMQNRERLLPLLQTIYTQQLLPLQRAVRLHLELKQRFDMIIQPPKLIWLTPNHVEQPIAPNSPIVDIFKQAGNGLLILGAAGAGKSTLLVDLAQELLQQAQQNPKLPFPVLLNISSWEKTQQPLEQWLADELLLQYRVPHRLTATWIATDLLFPLLDGLDEVKDTARAACINAINDYKQRHLLPLVVCCRSEVYPPQEPRLALQSAIEIQPLDLQEVTNYFSVTPSGKSINTALRRNKVLQELLTTPLMVQILLLAYQGKSAKNLPRRGSHEEQQHYLFESYIQQMLTYRATQGKPMPVQTFSWLSWLAQQMIQHGQSDFYLERLNVSWLPLNFQSEYWLGTGSVVGVVVLIVVWLVAGLVLGLLSGLVFGFDNGLVAGLVFGMTIGVVWTINEKNELVETITWSWKDGQVLRDGLRGGLLGGMYIGPFLGLVVGQLGGQLRGLLGGLLGGLLAGLVVGLTAGLLAGLVVGLSYGGEVYINHYILRYLLSRRGYLPWNYEQFLDQAAECILLQKVGGGYRFIHQEFLKYFASLKTPVPTHKAEAQAPQGSSSP